MQVHAIIRTESRFLPHRAWWGQNVHEAYVRMTY